MTEEQMAALAAGVPMEVVMQMQAADSNTTAAPVEKPETDEPEAQTQAQTQAPAQEVPTIESLQAAVAQAQAALKTANDAAALAQAQANASAMAHATVSAEVEGLKAQLNEATASVASLQAIVGAQVTKMGVALSTPVEASKMTVKDLVDTHASLTAKMTASFKAGRQSAPANPDASASNKTSALLSEAKNFRL